MEPPIKEIKTPVYIFMKGDSYQTKKCYGRIKAGQITATVVRHHPVYYVYTTFDGRDMPGFAAFWKKCSFWRTGSIQKYTLQNAVKHGISRHFILSDRYDKGFVCLPWYYIERDGKMP